MVRLALFSFQIARPVLTPAKNHAFFQSIRVHLQSKQQRFSPGFSAKLSHQLKVGCHLEPLTARQDSDVCRGPMNSQGYPFLHRGSGVEAGLSAPLVASSSTHQTCASGSCKCIHWHLPLFLVLQAPATQPNRCLISPTCSQRPKLREDPELHAQTCKPSLPLLLALNLTNSRCHFLAPAAGLSLPGFQLVAVMTTAPGSAQAGTLQGEKFPPTPSECLGFPEHPSQPPCNQVAEAVLRKVHPSRCTMHPNNHTKNHHAPLPRSAMLPCTRRVLRWSSFQALGELATPPPPPQCSPRAPG